MRLVFVSAARRWTGGERAMLTVAEGHARRGYEVLITADPRGPVAEAVPRDVRIVPVTIRNDADPAALLSLARAIRRFRADIVCVNTNRELKVGGLAARLARRGLVVNRMGTGGPLHNGWRHRLIYRALLDAVIRDSHAGCESIARENGWFRKRLYHARNGVDDAALARVVPMDREALGADADEVLVATIGRPGPVHGRQMLARAAADLSAGGKAGVRSKLRLVYIGAEDPDSDREISALAARSGFEVTFTGPRPGAETLRLLATCDIFVRPTTDDGLSFSVLEAQGLGLPVIATEVGGAPEAVADGRTGILVPPGDATALGWALENLVTNGLLRRRMGQAGRDRIAAEFTEERMLDEYESAFRDLLSAHGRG